MTIRGKWRGVKLRAAQILPHHGTAGACVPIICQLRLGMSNSGDSDHARAAHAHQVAIYRAMTPAQRLDQALRMNRSMRELLAAGFRMRQPAWSEEQIQRAVADRILYAATG